jgi:hypothetical protein
MNAERGIPLDGTSNAHGALGVHMADFRLKTRYASLAIQWPKFRNAEGVDLRGL